MTIDEINHSSVRAAAISQPESRERILDAAEKMFLKHGYLKVTVKDIAVVLDMSPANVYRFFDSKASLREALADRLTRQVEAQCARVCAEGGTASARMEALITEYHRMTLDRYLSAENVHEMLDAAMRENWRVIDGHMSRMKELIAGILADGIASGEFPVRDRVTAVEMVYYATIPFIDPALVARLFRDEENFKHVRDMGRFLTAALRAGSI